MVSEFFSKPLRWVKAAQKTLIRTGAVFLALWVAMTALPLYSLSEFADPRASNWFSDSVAIHALRAIETTFLPPGESIIALGPWDTFMMVTYVGAGIALVLMIPYLTWLAVRFVWPALRRSERAAMRWMGALGAGLFAVGLGVGVLVLPYLYTFAFQIQGPAGVAGTVSLNEFVTETLVFLLSLGAAFEIPVLCYGLGRFGVLKADMMKNNARWALLGSFMIAFVISPGVGGGLIEIPMALGFFGLYGLGYVLVKRAQRWRGDP